MAEQTICPATGKVCDCNIGPVFEGEVSANIVSIDRPIPVIKNASVEDYLRADDYITSEAIARERDLAELSIKLIGLVCLRDEQTDPSKRYIKVNYVRPDKPSIPFQLDFGGRIIPTFLTFHMASEVK